MLRPVVFSGIFVSLEALSGAFVTGGVLCLMIDLCLTFENPL